MRNRPIYLVLALAIALLAAPAAAQLASAEAAASLAITGFEDVDAAALPSWHGGQSTISLESATDIFHSGAKSLKVTFTNKDYCGFAFQIPADKADWSAYKTIELWVYGSNSGNSFNIYIEEGKGEQFVSGQKDNFAGWKKLSLSFAAFTSRTDYQAGDAVVDKILQLDAVKTIQSDASSGVTVLYYDDISLVK